MALTITNYEKTASGNECAQQCLWFGILIITNGTDDAVVNVYDDDATGTTNKVWETTVVGADNYGGAMFPHPIRMHDGINVTVSGTGASYITFYRPK